MHSRPVPSQRFTSDSSHEVGKECDYWKKFGEYIHQLAIDDGWLDAQGKLTPAGLQVIVSEQEGDKRRRELTKSLKPRVSNLKSRLKINGSHFKTSSSFRSNTGVSSALRTKHYTKSAFVDEVKALLAKINGKFVHLGDSGEQCRLVVRIPREKRGTTSHTFVGTLSDIRRELNALVDDIE